MAEMQQAPGPSRHRFQPAQKSCPPPNKSLQRTRRPSLRSGRSPLSSKPLGDLAQRGAECGERSPSPGHRNWQSLATLAAWWSWLSSHGGVGRVASSWQIGWRSSGTVAQSAARPSSGGAHSSPNTSLQRTRRPRFRAGRSLRSLGSPLSSNPLGVGSRLQPGWRLDGFVSREPAQHTDERLAENRPS